MGRFILFENLFPTQETIYFQRDTKYSQNILGMAPSQETVTTRITTCLGSGVPLNPYLPLLLGGGHTQEIYIKIIFGCFQKYGKTPQIIPFNRVSHYQPSILGYPYFWKHPNTRIKYKISSPKHHNFLQADCKKCYGPGTCAVLQCAANWADSDLDLFFGCFFFRILP